jgi:hypothetical protein
MGSLLEFKAAITRWKAERLGPAVKLFQQEAAQQIGTSIVRKTPVRTGLARGNWRLAIGNRVGEGKLTRKDPSGAAAISDIVQSASRLAAYSSFTLYNNLPYIARLENGSSQQAPLGMTRLALREFKAGLPLTMREIQRKLGAWKVKIG